MGIDTSLKSGTSISFYKQKVKKHDTFKHWIHLCRDLDHNPCSYQPWPKISREELRSFHTSTFMSRTSEKRGHFPWGIALLLTRRCLCLLKERRDPAALRGSTCKLSWRRICKQAKPQCPMAPQQTWEGRSNTVFSPLLITQEIM